MIKNIKQKRRHLLPGENGYIYIYIYICMYVCMYVCEFIPYSFQSTKIFVT